MDGTVSSTRQVPLSQRLVRGLGQVPLITFVLLLVFIVIYLRTPNFFQPTRLAAFVRGAAPLMIVTIGQMIVLVSGELDLSVGSLITVCAAFAARVIHDNPSRAGEAMVWIFAIALVVGLVNGIVTTRFHVPSFITTLAMMLIAQGVISIITGGASQGGLTDNFRVFGRGNLGDTGIPNALIITLVVIAISVYFLRKTTFGRRVYAVGSNPVAARLSGVNVSRVKIACFVICSLLACVGAILQVGFSGMASLTVGSGFEFQSISAAVLGGVALTGGRGSVFGAVAGALTLQAVFTLLNLLALPLPIRLTVQGLIILGAVAVNNVRSRRS